MTGTSPTTNGEAPNTTNKRWIGDLEDDWDKGSITKTWYRVKSSESSAYLRELSTKDREKLMVDEQRIEKTRARLLRDATKKEHVLGVQNALQDWRKEAFRTKDGKSKLNHDLADRGKGPKGNHLKDKVCPDYDADKEIDRDDDPSHDLTAGIMFFEKSDHGWKGVTHDKGSFSRQASFPDQKLTVHEALYDNKYNPFDPTFDNKGNRHLKYIHLPANHMGWVELPYLHWETSNRRASMAKAIQEVWKEEKLTNATTAVVKDEDAQIKNLKAKFRNRFNRDNALKHEAIAGWKAVKDARNKRTPLGEYLMALAKLWEAMDTELENRMIRCGLTTDKDRGTEPPLHIRRTLDQAYFLNLQDTSGRDEDQVVYRATRKSFRDPANGSITRVVMVDQLWLWILDEYTIITAFPKRWGHNKPDSSGIHKSLRERLDHTDKEIMSVWQLAFIIIDQCSRVFFDRTKPLDMRPEVMDIFAETLGEVNDYKTVAYEAFWRNIELFSKDNQKRRSMQPSAKYLDINPEGKLLREAQDIAEELRIMIGIYNQQLSVVKDFHKCLEQLNGHPKVGSKDRDTRRFIQHLRAESSHQAQAKPDRSFIPLKELEYLDDMIEEVENRRTELEDLEQAALRTCQQLQELLSLKQQQASIVEAKAALERADQSVEQGKAIMAFTIMTIIFTPLGFFTSFFGMNNASTGSEWMTLGRQCLYMFCLSAFIIIIVLVLAFNRRLRQPVTSLKRLYMYLMMEAKYVKQEKAQSISNGLRPSDTIAINPVNFHLAEDRKRSCQQGNLARILAICTSKTPDGSHYSEDVESKA
ncbi:hypothetical protein VMCG_05556 [Cytospora schulzeri]|uniref:Ankyrin repeat protein n=1 Tax=Cytospora schulzeri TaxID=448051 RepID=A0A423WET3_9PEZI|nr:hypothetical protein VMCG_05556 [Valsa malicola]